MYSGKIAKKGGGGAATASILPRVRDSQYKDESIWLGKLEIYVKRAMPGLNNLCTLLDFDLMNKYFILERNKAIQKTANILNSNANIF